MSGHHPDICWFCHHIIVILFVGNEALEALLIMSVFGLFLFLLGVNDIYAVFAAIRR